MDASTKRLLLFLFGCMGARLGLAWLAYAFPAQLPLMGALALVPALGFFVIWAGDLRKTGPEVFGDRIWWNDLRPVHAVLYATFAALALHRVPQAWVVLLLDAAVGFAAWAWHRWG